MNLNALDKAAGVIEKRPALIFGALALIIAFAVDMSAVNETALGVVFALIAGFSLLGAALFVARKMTTERLVALIFILGFLMRLAYIVYTSSTDRQHDVQQFHRDNGHAGYIMYFVNNGFRLPEGDPTLTYQFYHPPLWHFAAALFIKLQELAGCTIERSSESLQCLTLYFSTMCGAISYRIFKELGLKRGALCAATALVWLHPTYYILAGSVNNDVMSIMLLLLSVLCAFRWYREPTLKRIIPAALAIGLAMMTKSSGALAAPAMAFIFLQKLIEERKNKPARLIGQFAAFGAVCAPLGLWWQIRNKLLYNVPLFYVVGSGGPESEQYIGNFSVLQRLFDLQLEFPYISIQYYNNYQAFGVPLEHSIPISLLKTSVFGEWTLGTTNMLIAKLSYPLLWVNIVVALASIAAVAAVTARALKQKGAKRALPLSLSILWLTLMATEIEFCFDYPLVCTMNFRYIVPTVTVGAAFLAMWLSSPDKGRRPALAAKKAGAAITCVFCALGAAVYILLSGRGDALSAAAMLCAAALAACAVIFKISDNEVAA